MDSKVFEPKICAVFDRNNIWAIFVNWDKERQGLREKDTMIYFFNGKANKIKFVVLREIVSENYGSVGRHNFFKI